MAAVILRAFGGIAPAIPPRFLSEQQAQTAKNVRVYPQVGPLAPMRGLSSSLMTLAKSGTIKSIYKFGDAESATQYWFHWVSPDVDVVRGFVFGDVSKRTYFTGGESKPRVTDVTLALTGAGTAYPTNSYELGVPKPTLPLTVSNLNGVVAEEELSETRVYTYTWVNSWGEESEPFSADPMPFTHRVAVSEGQTVRVTMPTSPPGGPYNITHKRIYRSVAATAGAEYLYVGQVAAATATFDDAVDPLELGESLPSMHWSMPPENLRGLVGLPNGVLAGFVEQDVYFSEPYRPFAWPLMYQQAVGSLIVGLGVMDTTLVVLTNGKPYFIQGGHPDSMVMVEADIPQACVSKRSIASMQGAVIYASPDGLVQISPGGSSMITQGLFTREQWQSFQPEKIHAYVHDGKYIAFHDTGGFIVDPATGTFTLHELTADGGYADLLTDTLYLTKGRALHKWDAGTPMTYVWRSKQFTMPQPIGFTCIRVEAEAYPITGRLYRDGVLVHTYSFADNKTQRVPSGRGRLWEVELESTAEVFRVGLATSPKELMNG